MPSPGEDIQSWSVVAADNGTSDPLIDWHEGQARASVNNSARSEMAAIAKNRNLNNGSIVTTGTANAQQFLSGVNYTTIPTNLRATLKVGSGLTNTTSMTLNMDGLGDVLVKTAAGENLLGKEFTAGGYVDVLYNGTNWIFLYGREFFFDLMTGGGGIIIGHQIFSTAGTFTYTPTPGLECGIAEVIAGGGGGGASYSGTGNLFVGGGGGSGGYSRKYFTAADVGASLTVTVGAPGLGSASNSPGTSGGDSSFGSLCIARGGSGGHSGQIGYDIGGGGAGGVVGTGDIAAAGAPGMDGTFNGSPGGVYGALGGSSALGGGAVGTAVPAGNAASSYGSGGGGGISAGAVAGTGGNGSPGIVIITEFAGRGAPGRDGIQGPPGPTGPSGSGTGDVLRAGTPLAGQYAVWTDSSHIQGVTPSTPTPTPPQRTVLTGGAGTYTTPADAVWLEVELVGGGAGGASGASGTGGLLGNSGTATIFGTMTGGAGGNNGLGGTAAGGDVNFYGADGGQVGNIADGVQFALGTNGGNSFFGGAGGSFFNSAGRSAAPNTGSGGGGGGTNSTESALGGRGGGAGGYCRKLITPPAASYSYVVGSGGGGAATNGNNFAGGTGANGIIIITAHFGA